MTNNTVTFPVPTDSADSSARRRGPALRGRPFPSGRSGNPNGRPKGARNKETLAAQALVDGAAEAITRKCIELATAGNIPALRLCIERLIPPRRDRLVTFDLPLIENADDAKKASAAVLAACANGELTPDEAESFISMISGHSRIIDTAQFEDRLRQLEERQHDNA